MKYFQLTFLVFLITQNLFALTSGFNFQAVLRDAEGNILANEDVEITISLLSLDGKEVYSETHTTKTNATGLMSLVIGEGTSDINFSDIEWSNKYDLVIKVNGEEFDPQPLNSVPYALYAENGLTSELIEAIEANIAKVGITPAQDSAIALISNTSGYYNTAFGIGALDTIRNGNLNTAIGHSALALNTDGSGNTAVGFEALKSNSTTQNTAIGSGALALNTIGTFNTALGANALRGNVIGGRNTAVGRHALFFNNGSANTALGGESLNQSLTGDNNVAIGHVSGISLINGSDNIFIGKYSDPSSPDATNQVVIGTGAVGQADNTVTLGNSSVTDIYAAEDGEAIIHAGGITFSDGTTQTTASSSDGGSGGGTSSSNVTFNQVLTSGFTDSTTVLEIGNFTIRVKSIDNSNHYLEWKVNTGDISDYFAATVTMKGSRAADWNAMNVEPVVGNNSGIRAEDTFTEIVDRTNNYTGGESGGYLNSPGLWYYKTVEVELTNEQHNESYKITAIVNGLGKVMLKGEHWDFK